MVQVVTFLFVIITWLSGHVFFRPDFNSASEEYLVPPKVIQYFTAGFKIQAADTFWLRAVQDFDYCGIGKTQEQCSGKSWLFSVLDLSSTLDPMLEPVMYQTGGLALSVVISDVDGAAQFFNRGVHIYPKNWQLVYAAAYHALYEEKNNVKAARLYLQAYENGAPEWVQVLAGKLASAGGDHEFAEKVLQEMIDQNKDEKLIARLKNKLNEVRAGSVNQITK